MGKVIKYWLREEFYVNFGNWLVESGVNLGGGICFNFLFVFV